MPLKVHLTFAGPTRRVLTVVVALALLGGWGPRGECVLHPGADGAAAAVKEGCCSKAAAGHGEREKTPAPRKAPCSQCTKICCGFGVMYVPQGEAAVLGGVERVSGVFPGDDRVVLGPVGQSIFHPPRVG